MATIRDGEVSAISEVAIVSADDKVFAARNFVSLIDVKVCAIPLDPLLQGASGWSGPIVGVEVESFHDSFPVSEPH